MKYNSKLHGRRLKYIAITPDIIVDILYNHSKYLDGRVIIPIIEGLPENCQVIGVDYDFLIQAFRLVLQHESFEEVPDGEIIPKLGSIGLEFRSVKIEQESNAYKFREVPFIKELHEQEFNNEKLKENPFQKYRDLV